MTLKDYGDSLLAEAALDDSDRVKILRLAKRIYESNCTSPAHMFTHINHKRSGPFASYCYSLKLVGQIANGHPQYRSYFQNWAMRHSVLLCKLQFNEEETSLSVTFPDYSPDTVLETIVLEMEQKIIKDVMQFDHDMRVLNEMMQRHDLQRDSILLLRNTLKQVARPTFHDEEFFMSAENRNQFSS